MSVAKTASECDVPSTKEKSSQWPQFLVLFSENTEKMKSMDLEPAAETSKLWPQYVAALSAVLMTVSCGLHFGWPSPSIPKLLNGDLPFTVNRQEISYIVMLTPLAYIIGSPVSAFLLDRIGRKAAILVLVFPQIIAWILIANSNHIAMLYAARITAGLSEGGTFTAVPIYIGEVSESKIRGSLGTFFTLALIFGSLLMNCYGSFTSIKTAAYISICLPLLVLLIFIWMPESPYYLLMKGQQEEARNSLKRLRRMKNVEEELTKLTRDVQRQTSEPNNIKDIFIIKSNLKAFMILIGLRTLQQYSGGASVNFYNQVIFQESKANISYTTSSIIFNATLFSVGVIATPLVDRFGRKPVLLISTLGSSCCVLVEGIYFYFLKMDYNLSRFNWVPLAALVGYTVVRGIGLMSIPTLMAGELFSASIKAKALSIVNLYLAFCISSSAKMFQVLDDSFGMYAPFFMFTIVSYCGLVFISLYVPETKGKSLEEIQQELKGESI